MNMQTWITTSSGKVMLPADAILQEEMNGVTLISMQYEGDVALNMDEGACINLCFDDRNTPFMADYRHSEFWCRPAFGQNLSEVPDETQGLLLKHADGSFTAIIPVVSEQYKCVLRGEDDGTITARLFSWYEGLTSLRGLAIAMKTGTDPYSLLKECVQAALKKLNNGSSIREERSYPEIFEYLGWCSWDSMQIRVNEDGLLQKCREFKDKQIPVRWAIIDDMWAHVNKFHGAKYNDFGEMIRLMHASPLYDFKGDPERFPNGLDSAIARMKEFGLKVGMWHPTTGYWYGIDPEGPLFQRLKDTLIQMEDGRWVVSPELGKAFTYYHTLHEFLKESGADFLKVDNQSMSRRFYKGQMPVGQAARNEHVAIEASCGLYFGNGLINCMGMANEDMWNRPMSAISRCSDDFLPENRSWFTKHILQCSYNSLIQGQLLWCDWDMWWTNDGQAVKNSVLRAISGGPIYVSDKINESRAEILKPLHLSDGRILRTDRPAVPTVDCLLADPEESEKPFKLQSKVGQCGIVAAFNLNSKNEAVTGTVSPCEVPGLNTEKYVIYEHFTGIVHIVLMDEAVTISLKSQDEFALYVIVPYVDGYAAIGLVDKFISPKAIESVSETDVVLKDHGRFAYVKNGELFIEEK